MTPVLTSPLVSTQWLADHLGADDLVVVDASVCTFPDGQNTTWVAAEDDYAAFGHVPGAVFADLVDEFSDSDGTVPFTRPDGAQFARAVGALGIRNGATTVIYDGQSGQWAARLWWLFRSFGVDDVAVLDGGFRKWRAEDRPIRLGRIAPRSATFLVAEERPLWADRARVRRAVDGVEPATLVAAATASELGLPSPALIPGSTTVPVRDVVDTETNVYHRPSALSRVFAPVLADPAEIVTYCGVGSAACVDALALTMLGRDDVQVYDGSMFEWVQAGEPLAS